MVGKQLLHPLHCQAVSAGADESRDAQTAQVRLNADGTRSAQMPATGVIGRLSRCGYELIYLNRALAILRA
jgi:hypothetical protein